MIGLAISQRRRRRRRLPFVAAQAIFGLVGSSMLAGPALAGERQDAALPAVEVRAQKLPEPARDVPAGLTTLDGYQLRADGADSVSDLAPEVPGLSFQPSGQSALNAPVMRGLTANPISFSSSALMLVDGIPYLAPQGFESHLVGVDQVEVLRGPQFALYGRNAHAGVIRITTKEPGPATRVNATAAAGSRDRRSLRLNASGPLVEDTLYGSVAGGWREQDGFLDNTFSGTSADDRRRIHGRGVLRWTPAPHTDVTLRYSAREYDDGAARWGSGDGTEEEVRSGSASWTRSNGRTAAMDISHRLADNLRLRSITAYNQFDDRVRQDTDFMPVDLFRFRRNQSFNLLTQEFRLQADLGEARGVMGLYFDRERNELSFQQKTPRALNRTAADLDGRTAALFSQWRVPLGGPWSATIGGRAEYRRVALEPRGKERRSEDWTRLSPKLALHRQLGTSASAYLSLAEGFLAGGFNAFAPSADFAAFDPERVRSAELGVRGTLAQRWRYAATLYAMDINDLQVQRFAAPGQTFIDNAAEATSVGGELEATWAVGNGLRLRGALALNRTRFEAFRADGRDFSGNHNPFVPDVNAMLGLRYDHESGFYTRARASGTSRIYLDAANEETRPGYARLDLGAGYAHGAIEAELYADNVTGSEYDAEGFLNGTATVYSPPREVGLRLRLNY